MKKGEGASGAKSRIKRFEKHNKEGLPHRLALTYASNQPGDVPKNPSYMKAVQKRYEEGMGKIKAAVQSVNPFHKVAEAMKPKSDKPQDIGQKAYDEAVKRGRAR